MGLGRGNENEAAAVPYTNGKSRHEPGEATMSPWIMDLIRRFTLLDGTALDLPALARRPQSMPAQ